MSIIGLDFGSHSSSLALYNCENDTIEVFADDMGSRCIPCVVAFRGEEILVGQVALAQRYKNGPNTFSDLRNIVERVANGEIEDKYVPILEKSLPPLDIVAHFFRHIHNQVKQQMGKVVRDMVVTVPVHANEAYKEQLKLAAKAGGIRIKAFLADSAGALLAHKFDAPQAQRKNVCVVDLGWSSCDVSFYEVQSGIVFPVSSRVSCDITGKSIVDAVAAHCVKDFQRRSKVSCEDNKRAMTRLQLECEGAVRILSTAAETAISIDSLHEGIDYSGRLSRARFEDLNSVSFVSFKRLIEEALSACSPSFSAADISDVIMAGE
jgi:molecular chaperone DnaK (HSP70)